MVPDRIHASLVKHAATRYQERMTPKGLHFVVAAGLLSTLFSRPASAAGDPLLDVARKISTEAAGKGEAYANLKQLTTIGPRLSGSAGAAKAVEWAKAKMASYGFDRVVLVPTMVPHWTRGPVEQATAVSPTRPPLALKVAALGPSVGTPQEGVTAGVVEVHSLDEVETLGPAVRGKIVFYNRPMGTAGNIVCLIVHYQIQLSTLNTVMILEYSI